VKIEVCRLTSEWLEDAFELLASDPNLCFKEWERARITEGLLGNDQIYLIAHRGKTLLGILIGGVTLRAHIDHLIVAPGHRDRKIGSLLVAAAEEEFEARGVLRGRLTLTAENAHGPVRRFYEARGYHVQEGEVGLERDF